MTIYLGSVLRANGYAGATAILYLVEDGARVLAVYPGGFFEYGATRAEALGRSDIIEFTPARG